jgi:hypothetical protein
VLPAAVELPAAAEPQFGSFMAELMMPDPAEPAGDAPPGPAAPAQLQAQAPATQQQQQQQQLLPNGIHQAAAPVAGGSPAALLPGPFSGPAGNLVPPVAGAAAAAVAPGSPPDHSVARVASLSNWIAPVVGSSPSPRSRPPAIPEGAEGR